MKIKYGSMATDGSGKLGGHVFTKSRGTATMRTNIIGNNPSSSTQMEKRAALASNSALWSTLTDAQRASFNDQVELYPYINSLGEKRTPSGFQLFSTLNANLALLGKSPIKQLGEFLAPASINYTAATLDLKDNTTSLSTNSKDVADGKGYVIFASRPNIKGRQVLINDMRIINVEKTFNTISNSSIAPQYTSRFGALSVGDYFFIIQRNFTANGNSHTQNKVKVVVIDTT